MAWRQSSITYWPTYGARRQTSIPDCGALVYVYTLVRALEKLSSMQHAISDLVYVWVLCTCHLPAKQLYGIIEVYASMVMTGSVIGTRTESCRV